MHIEQVSSSLHNILDKALNGRNISLHDGYELMEAPTESIPAICEVASKLRSRTKGQTVTYSRKVFIPLTTLCRDSCGYCTFAKPPDHPDAITLNPDEVLTIARTGEKNGCKEALFSLGERPELTHEIARKHLRQLGYETMLDYLHDMCELVLNETNLIPHINPGSLTYEEMCALRQVSPSMGMMLESSSIRLTERNGPHFGCPDKHPLVRLNTLRFAGELRVPFTTGILIGIGETRAERVDSLFDIRQLHLSYGHIQEVIVQNFRAKPNTSMFGLAELNIDEMIRTLAVARIILGPEMNLQAPPNLMPSEYGRYLKAGINDWGGVSPVTPDHINPEADWPKIRELQSVSNSMGHILRERLSVYPDYLRDSVLWLDANFQNCFADLVSPDGLISEIETVL
ncbi:MAG: 7,8-didemethyl-8-hydroxy-5-deazariboflavin synthase subunit CofG [Anaerolineaceae bacterium]|nr:7,8-didemethyl-8-hydroxy-5-deazariboflavin synthase subunit CofG [Anaerolineaceae bacterium]